MSAPTPYYETPADAPSRVRLYHGDCREILPLVAPPSLRVLVLADPVYGVGHTTRINRAGVNGAKRIGGGRVAKSGKNRVWSALFEDDRPFDPSHLLAYPRLLVWGWNHFADRMPCTPSTIVWWKRAGSEPDDGSDFEEAWTNLGGPARLFPHCWRGVCRASEGSAPPLHPTQKPVAFYRWLFAGRGRGKPVVAPGDLIVVPYLGSGPEIPAAMELGLDVVGIDVEREYLDTTIKHRIEPALERGRQVDIWARKPPSAEQRELFALGSK